jgi:hypothetical protein
MSQSPTHLKNMSAPLNTGLAMATLGLLTVAVGSACREEPAKAATGTAPTTQQARKAVERGLDFVVKDAVQGRADQNGATGEGA